jgi:hypothetical protein
MALPHFMQSSLCEPEPQFEQTCAIAPPEYTAFPHLMHVSFFEPEPQLLHNCAIAITCLRSQTPKRQPLDFTADLLARLHKRSRPALPPSNNDHAVTLICHPNISYTHF